MRRCPFYLRTNHLAGYIFLFMMFVGTVETKTVHIGFSDLRAVGTVNVWATNMLVFSPLLYRQHSPPLGHHDESWNDYLKISVQTWFKLERYNSHRCWYHTPNWVLLLSAHFYFYSTTKTDEHEQYFKKLRFFICTYIHFMTYVCV